MQRNILDIRKGENCPKTKRIVTSESVTEFPLLAIHLVEYHEVRGNPTELCPCVTNM